MGATFLKHPVHIIYHYKTNSSMRFVVHTPWAIKRATKYSFITSNTSLHYLVKQEA